MGVEPTRDFSHQPLKLARLPIPPQIHELHWCVKKFKERLDAFPTQLWLTIIWAVPISAIAMLSPLGRNLYFISGISLYAIVVTHFTAHIAWKAECEAKKAAESDSAKRTDEPA